MFKVFLDSMARSKSTYQVKSPELKVTRFDLASAGVVAGAISLAGCLLWLTYGVLYSIGLQTRNDIEIVQQISGVLIPSTQVTTGNFLIQCLQQLRITY